MRDTQQGKEVHVITELVRDARREKLNAIAKGVDKTTNGSGPGDLIIGRARPQGGLGVTDGEEVYVESGMVLESGTKLAFEGQRKLSSVSGLSSLWGQVDETPTSKGGTKTIARDRLSQPIDGGKPVTEIADAAPGNHLFKVVNGHLCVVGNDPREHSNEDAAWMVGGGFIAWEGQSGYMRTRFGDCLVPTRRGVGSGEAIDTAIERSTGTSATRARNALAPTTTRKGGTVVPTGGTAPKYYTGGQSDGGKPSPSGVYASAYGPNIAPKRLDQLNDTFARTTREDIDKLTEEIEKLYDEAGETAPGKKQDELYKQIDEKATEQARLANKLIQPKVDVGGEDVVPPTGFTKGDGSTWIGPDGREYVADFVLGRMVLKGSSKRDMGGPDNRFIQAGLKGANVRRGDTDNITIQWGLWTDPANPPTGVWVKRPPTEDDLNRKLAEYNKLVAKGKLTEVEKKRLYDLFTQIRPKDRWIELETKRKSKGLTPSEYALHQYIANESRDAYTIVAGLPGGKTYVDKSGTLNYVVGGGYTSKKLHASISGIVPQSPAELASVMDWYNKRVQGLLARVKEIENAFARGRK